MKNLEKAEQNKLKTSRKKEVRTKIHENENIKTIKEPMKPIDCSLTNICKTDYAPFPYQKGKDKLSILVMKKRISLQMLQT